MPSPFPGMDPYLEAPWIWPDVHHELISEIQAALNARLRPRYVARVDLRVYLSGVDDPGRTVAEPDLLMDEIEEAFLRIVHVESEELVTLIERYLVRNKQGGRSSIARTAKLQQKETQRE